MNQENNKQNENPLLKYTRRIKFYTSIPSGGRYPGDNPPIALNDDGEVGIKAMTSVDEATLKNPDSLLNGKAVKQIMLSCVEGMVRPEDMFMNDIDRLLVAIKCATYDGEAEIQVDCPECGEENNYKINLENILQLNQELEHEYPVKLDNGVTVVLRPMTFKESLKARGATFEFSKVSRMMNDDNMDEELRLKKMSESFNKVTQMNFEMTCQVIDRVEVDEQSVTDKHAIQEFMLDLESSQSKRVNDKYEEISTVGKGMEHDLNCSNEDCLHEWKQVVNFNPIDFFMEN